MMKTFSYNGEFKVLKRIAEGGMGDVYLAEQMGGQGFSKTVALKTLRKENLGNSLNIDLFIGEAKLVADLIHENVVQVYQFMETEAGYTIVMEFIHGLTVDDINDQLDEVQKYFPPDLAGFVTSRVARALDYAHRKTGRRGESLNIVHRDVSPSNIMINWEGVVKLSDFGIAKASAMRKIDERRFIVGKTPYLAPEQVQMKGADARSDIYSLGLVCYELLTGRQAYPVDTADELIQAHRKGSPESVRAIDPRIPVELEAIVKKMIAPKPEDRFQTAREIVDVLESEFLYAKGYGPTNEKLRDYLAKLFPGKERARILPTDFPTLD